MGTNCGYWLDGLAHSCRYIYGSSLHTQTALTHGSMSTIMGCVCHASQTCDSCQKSACFSAGSWGHITHTDRLTTPVLWSPQGGWCCLSTADTFLGYNIVQLTVDTKLKPLKLLYSYVCMYHVLSLQDHLQSSNEALFILKATWQWANSERIWWQFHSCLPSTDIQHCWAFKRLLMLPLSLPHVLFSCLRWWSHKIQQILPKRSLHLGCFLGDNRDKRSR